jgi:hypothetical protein
MQIIVIFFLISSTFWLTFENSSLLWNIFTGSYTSPLFRPKKEDKQWDIRSSFVFWLLFRMFLFSARENARLASFLLLFWLFFKKIFFLYYIGHSTSFLFFSSFTYSVCTWRRLTSELLRLKIRNPTRDSLSRGENWRKAKNGDKRNTNISESFISCAHTHIYRGTPLRQRSSRQHRFGFLVIFQNVSFHTWGVFWFKIFIGAFVRVKLCVSSMRIWISRRKWRRWRP